MKKFFTWLLLGIKGFCMGAANDVPGVSGGTIAFITGIYQRLIDALSKLDMTALKLLFTGRFKELWRHLDGGFLLPLFIGMAVGILSLSKVLLICLNDYPIPTKAFFFGLVLASALPLFKNFNGKKTSDLAWIAAGIAVGVGVAVMGLGTETTSSAESANAAEAVKNQISQIESGGTPYLFVFICGVISICAMILPGISGSFILMVMGMYTYIQANIYLLTRFNGHAILVILVFALGCLVGVVLFSKFLHWLLAKWEHQTLVLITGFVLGSLVAIWPWIGYSSAPDAQDMIANPHILDALIAFVAGGLVIAVLEGLGWLVRRHQNGEEAA